MPLLDHTGRPMVSQKKILSDEVAKPGLTGVRQAWSAESAVAGLTPDKLGAIIRQADQGDMDAFLTLAEEMEERDPHYGSVLQTRKLAVTGLPMQLQWAQGLGSDAQGKEIQEACDALIEAPCFEDLQFHQLDAIAKGYAVSEIIWDTTGPRWTPARYEERDPRWFQWDRETGRQLRLKETGALDGVELPANKFAVHLALRKSGLPARGGLARLVAFSFICKLYGLKDWMAYAEIFGIPLRLGKYDAAARPEDVEVLKRAVFGLGSDAAAVIPAGMEIDFPTAGGGAGGPELFMRLVEFLDTQVSKAVLGQAGTTDMKSGGGYAQAKVLDEVRGDLTAADAKSLGNAITSSVLRPFVTYNWGPDAPCPKLVMVVETPEDTDALSTALERLVPLGLEVDQDEIREKFKLSKPAAGAKLLTPPKRAEPPAAGQPGADPANDEAAPGEPPVAANARDRRRASLARAGSPEARQAAREQVDADLDQLQLAELEGWTQTFGAETERVLEVVRSSASLEEIRSRLTAMAGDLAAPAVARSLTRAMFPAAIIGTEQAS